MGVSHLFCKPVVAKKPRSNPAAKPCVQPRGQTLRSNPAVKPCGKTVRPNQNKLYLPFQSPIGPLSKTAERDQEALRQTLRRLWDGL